MERAELTIVVDASVLLADILPDEPSSGLLEYLGASLGRVMAPGHLVLEVGNALALSTRRSRLASDVAEQIFASVDTLDIELAPRPSFQQENLLRLAFRHHLTVYDAAYLDLAITNRATLATVDGALRKAALAERLSVWPPEP